MNLSKIEATRNCFPLFKYLSFFFFFSVVTAEMGNGMIDCLICFPESSTDGRVCLQCRRPWFDSWVGKIHWRRDRLPTSVFLDFPCGLVGKESTCNVGDLGSILGLRRSPGERKGYPLQYPSLENSMDCVSPWGHKESDRTKQLSLHFVSAGGQEDWKSASQQPLKSLYFWTH